MSIIRSLKADESQQALPIGKERKPGTRALVRVQGVLCQEQDTIPQETSDDQRAELSRARNGGWMTQAEVGMSSSGARLS